MPLKSNSGKSFQGSIVLGKGFILTPEEAHKLIAKDSRNKEVLFPYLNGDDLNNSPTQKPSRWVINFFDWSEEKARSYPDCFDIVERLVKPERDSYDETKNSWNKSVKTNWWQFGAWRKALERAISELDQVMVIAEVTKYVSFVLIPVDLVFMHTLKVISNSDWENIAMLNSSIYAEWAWKYSSTMGSGTLRYTPSTSYETFPFKNIQNSILASVGEKFYYTRKDLMQVVQLGLTDIYNLIHNKKVKYITREEFEIEEKQFGKTYGKTALKLKKCNTYTNYIYIIQRIEKLRLLIVEMDRAVVNLYDWSDIELNHSFYELDYLPKNDRVRFTIHPSAKKELLKRLLLLNLQEYHENSMVSNLNKSISKKGKKVSSIIISNTLFPED